MSKEIESAFSVDFNFTIYEHAADPKAGKVQTKAFFGPVIWPYQNMNMGTVVGVEMLLNKLVSDLTEMGMKLAVSKGEIDPNTPLPGK